MNNSLQSFVTIVSGLPRSGTSMMMQMLAAGGLPVLSDNIRQADEDNTLGYYEFEPVKRTKSDPSWLSDAPGKVVKMVFSLLYDLPENYSYRVVFMNRDLEEVLASQQRMLERLGEQGASIPAERLKQVFAQQIEKVCVWLAEQPHFEVVKIDYRDVVSDPESQARRVSDFLGGSLDLASMAAVVNPSLYRQRRDS